MNHFNPFLIEAKKKNARILFDMKRIQRYLSSHVSPRGTIQIYEQLYHNIKSMGKAHLDSAKKAKQDEFYTQYGDIQRELKIYKEHFKGKVVYCNCDDPRESQFFRYFSYNFEHLGLKKLIATCYKNQNPLLFSKNDTEKAVYQVYEGDKNGNYIPDDEEIEVHELKGNGDFRSRECIELLKQADIVVTNPPFSLWIDYVKLLIKEQKNFLIVGPLAALTYKDIFPLIKENKIWMGINGVKEFLTPSGETQKFGNIGWYTNLTHHKRNEKIKLIEEYDPEIYPKYDNYDGIHITKVSDVPKDYDGAMGVPISFLDKYNPDQFEIIQFRKGDDGKDLKVNGKSPFFRILIKRKQHGNKTTKQSIH